MSEPSDAPKTCPNCGAVLENDAPFCPRCGAALLPVPTGHGYGRTCLGVLLILVAAPLGAFGGCMVISLNASGRGAPNDLWLIAASFAAALLF